MSKSEQRNLVPLSASSTPARVVAVELNSTTPRVESTPTTVRTKRPKFTVSPTEDATVKMGVSMVVSVAHSRPFVVRTLHVKVATSPGQNDDPRETKETVSGDRVTPSGERYNVVI